MEFPDYIKAKQRTNNKELDELYVFNDNLSTLGIGKKYFIKTYGCQMNEHDSENIKAMIEKMGYVESKDYKEADLVVLNTCSIRENAHNKAFGMLGRLKHLKEDNPNLVIGLCGCMAQEEGVIQEIINKRKYVDFVIGTHNLHHLPEVLNRSISEKHQEIEVFSKEGNIVEGIPVKRENPYKAYVNIIYGCDKFCTYCIVPFTRGKQRSRNPKDIIMEVEQLVKDGYQEVTLLGQNVNAYGKDFDYEYNMENLLEDVAKTNISRIFFMTSHPWDFTDGMIDVIAKYSNIMPFVHLPVQSGSSRVLKLMGRRYTKEEYITLFDKIRERIPGVVISTDIIVGFPTETEEDFNETLDLVKHCKYDSAYTFIYSPREKTPAAAFNEQVPESIKEQRLYKLNDLINKYSLESNKIMLNKVVPVLVEGVGTKKNVLFGYTDTKKLINFTGDKSLIGKIVNVKVLEAKSWSLDGEYVGE